MSGTLVYFGSMSMSCSIVVVIIVITLLILQKTKTTTTTQKNVQPPRNFGVCQKSGDPPSNYTIKATGPVSTIEYNHMPDGMGHIWPDCLISVIPSQKSPGTYVAIWAEAINFRSTAKSSKLDDHYIKGSDKVFGWNSCQKTNADTGYADWNTGGAWLQWVYPLPNGTWVGLIHTESGVKGDGSCAVGGDPQFKRIGVTFSTDEGLTWSIPKVIISVGTYVPQQWGGVGDFGGAYHCETNTLYCYFKGQQGLGVARSQDYGQTWKVWYNNNWIDAVNAPGYTKLNVNIEENVNVHFNTYLNCYVMIGWVRGTNQVRSYLSKDCITWTSEKTMTVEGDPLAPDGGPFVNQQGGKSTPPIYPFIIGDNAHYEAGETARLYYAQWDNDQATAANGARYDRRHLRWRPIKFSK